MYLPGRLDKRAPGGVLTGGALAVNVVLLCYSTNGEKHIALPLVVVPSDRVPWSHRESLDHDESWLPSNVLTIYRAKVIVVESCSRLKKYIGECKGRPGQQGQDRGHNPNGDFPFARYAEEQWFFVNVKFVHNLISFLILAFAGPEGCRGHFWPFIPSSPDCSEKVSGNFAARRGNKLTAARSSVAENDWQPER